MKRRASIGAAAVALPLAVAAVLMLGGGDGGGGAAAGPPSGATGTAVVARRTLAERLTATGRIGYAGESTVVGRLAGTVTWLPAVGDVIRRGERLYGIEGEPVVLMYGQVPAYRELAAGVPAGPDVAQLEENLAALGYAPATVDEEFTAATAAAVAAWQEELGLEATGAVELGRVAFLAGPRRVTEVEATLGEGFGSGGGGGTLAGAAPQTGAAVPVAYVAPSVADGVEPPSPPDSQAPGGEPPSPETDRGEPGPDGEPGGEPHQRPEPPAGRGAPTASPEATPPSTEPRAGEGAGGGGSEAPSAPVLETTSTRRVVTVELEPDQQSMTRRGQEVEVLLPGGAEAQGVVRQLAAVEESEEAPDGEAEAELEVTVALTGGRRIPALDGATVSVVFTRGVREDVLAVPLTALLAIGGDRFAVVAEEGARSRQVEVQPGLAADGYVEVAGRGLREGMRVEVAE